MMLLIGLRSKDPDCSRSAEQVASHSRKLLRSHSQIRIPGVAKYRTPLIPTILITRGLIPPKNENLKNRAVTFYKGKCWICNTDATYSDEKEATVLGTALFCTLVIWLPPVPTFYYLLFGTILPKITYHLWTDLGHSICSKSFIPT